MAGIKVTNKLNGGIDTDTTPEALNNTKLRDAVNVDIYDTGKYSKLTNIRGTTNILSYLPDNTDLTTLNILGVFNIEFLADYAGTRAYESHKVLIIFTYDATNGSQITIVDLVTNQAVLMYPNVDSTESLDFPVDGTISASYTKDRGIPEIYWDDNKNELRKLILRYSTAPTFVFPTLADINVRHKFGGVEPTFIGYGTNGYTTAGTYQVFYRFYNSTKNTSTKWSLPTNPIPISNAVGCFFEIPIGDGAQIGQTVSKTIKLSIDFTDTPSALYDSIQLAVVKNIDGLTIPSNTVYITLPSKDWYDNPTDIEYSDAVSFEAPYPLENIILDDAAIKCAKTQLIKDNVLVRGNIEYNNFENDRGTVDFDDAYTIKDNVCYNDGSDVVEKKGHFREEVYAYAVAYYDEFFNFGLVQPLDFTKVYKMNAKRTLTVTSIGTPDTYNQLNIVVSSTAGLACGDYLRYLNKAYQVCEVTNGTTMLIKYRPDLTTTSGSADLEVLYGQEGNQMQGWTWKFPARSDNKFAIFSGAFSVPQGLGLHIEGLKNHPTWAKGFVIVRQDRIKNILFQSPHIPAIAVQGVATQGLGPITYDNTDLDNINKFDTSKADYKGQLDFIAPKIMGLGHAMNIVKAYIQFEFRDRGINQYDRYYIAEYPVYVRQKKSYSNAGYSSGVWFYEITGINTHGLNPGGVETLNTQYGAETPKALYVVPPDYIMNNAGQPTFNYVLTGNEKVEIVDAIALERQELNDESPNIDISNLYLAVPTQGYYYSKQGYILQNTTDKVYFVKLSELDTDILGVTVNKGYDTVLGQAPLTLDNYIFDSDTYKNINIINGTEQLSVQQGQPRPVPPATNSFINVCATQRGKLLLTNNTLLDFTKVIYDEVSGTGNLFPNISSGEYDTKMYDVAHLEDDIGAVGNSGDDWFNIKDVPVKNIFTDAEKINSGSYILNITKGLPDNRYSQISNNWRFTGAVHILTESEVANNTPIDIDVWGGDCFLTNYQIKINNNTPRISDIFQTISDEAKDYIQDDNSNYFTFEKSVKTGSFKNNVELMMLVIESEVNTGYIKDNEKVDIGKPTTYFSKPFLYQYNGSYSINNVLKSFVTKAPDIFKGTRYQARYVWSKTRLYQAEGSAFIDTEGFDFFPVDNKRDLDEQYGGITSLVDFGDYMLHLIQEHKVRTEPINRTITQTADNQTLVMLATNFVGTSGQYMPFANGSQHIRSVQSFNGTCFFMDAQRRMLVTFGAGGYSVLSQNDINKYFKDTFGGNETIKEKDLIGIINTVQEKQQYWLIKTEADRQSQKAIIYDVRGKNFNTKIDTGTDLILNGVSNGEFLFLNHGKSLFTAYTNEQFGYLLDKYRDSKFTIIINDYPSYTKTFNVMNFEMKGGFILNKDSIVGTTPNNFAGIQRTPNMLIWDSASGQLPPFQNRNFQYWLNRIRQNTTPKYKMRGDYMIVDFIVVNDLSDNREVSIASIITDCEINARVR